MAGILTLGAQAGLWVGKPGLCYDTPSVGFWRITRVPRSGAQLQKWLPGLRLELQLGVHLH